MKFFLFVFFLVSTSSAVAMYNIPEETTPLIAKSDNIKVCPPAKKPLFFLGSLIGNTIIIGTAIYLYYDSYHKSLDYYSENFNVSNTSDEYPLLHCDQVTPCDSVYYSEYHEIYSMIPEPNVALIINNINKYYALSNELIELIKNYLTESWSSINNCIAQHGVSNCARQNYGNNYCFLDHKLRGSIHLYHQMEHKGTPEECKLVTKFATYSAECMARPNGAFWITILGFCLYNGILIFCGITC